MALLRRVGSARNPLGSIEMMIDAIANGTSQKKEILTVRERDKECSAPLFSRLFLNCHISITMESSWWNKQGRQIHLPSWKPIEDLLGNKLLTASPSSLMTFTNSSQVVSAVMVNTVPSSVFILSSDGPKKKVVKMALCNLKCEFSNLTKEL